MGGPGKVILAYSFLARKGWSNGRGWAEMKEEPVAVGGARALVIHSSELRK